MPKPAVPDDRAVVDDRRSSAVRRPWPRRVLRIVALVFVLLFIVAQLAGNVSHGTRSAGASSAAHGTSHVDEARGHLNAILDLFR